MNPLGASGTYDGTSSGAAKIKVGSYGGAVGLGFGYTRQDVSGRSAPQTA